MAKITLNNLTSNYGSQALHNANNNSIEDALNNKVLYRDNPEGEPNQMETDLDMNSRRILNLPDGITGNEPATISQLDGIIVNSLADGQLGDALETAVEQAVLEAVTQVAEGYVVQKVETQTGFTGGQTVVTLTTMNYVMGGNNLVVVRNGLVQTSGTDYTEDSTTQVTVTPPLASDDMLIFRANDTTTNTVADSNNVSHTTGGSTTTLASYLDSRATIVDGLTTTAGIDHDNGTSVVTLDTHLDSESARIDSLESGASGSWTNVTGNSLTLVLTGVVTAYAGATAPEGWLLCNGSAIDRGDYSDLFAVIGTTYGSGNGATTFHLPDLRGEFVRGLDSGRGVDSSRTLGSNQSHAFQSHNHKIGYEKGTSRGSPDNPPGLAVASQTTQPDVNTSIVGGTETRPRNVAMNYIIKI